MSRDYAHSVRVRLLNIARRDGEDFQRLLVRYVIERLLYRLSASAHANGFILKGATLFALWFDKPHRATKDLDLLGHGQPDVAQLIEVFREVAVYKCAEDGVVFDHGKITGSQIRKEARYLGVRLTVPANLAGALIRVQVDVGIGDVVIPTPSIIKISTLLNLPSPRLRAYAPETVVAEKLEALVVLGLTTSRMKDFYDLDFIRQAFEFDDTLIEAVRATFARRATPIPTKLPIGLSDTFSNDKVKQLQWKAFIRKSGIDGGLILTTVVQELRAWLWPILQQIRAELEAELME